MPASPFPITATDTNEAITQMQSLMDDLYQNRLGGACVGDVFMVDDDDIFKLKYLAIGGLQKVSGSLAILPNTSKGIDCDRNGIFVVLKADNGLAFDTTNGMYVELKTGGGISVDSNGLYLTTSPATKATGAEIDTGTDDTKYVTPKAIKDSYLGRQLKAIRFNIKDGTLANTIKCETRSNYNGDVITSTDNIAKGATTGAFTLDATGSILKIEAAGLTGNVLGILSTTINYNTSALSFLVDYIVSANDIELYFFNSSTPVDLTTIGAGTSIWLGISYVTSA